MQRSKRHKRTGASNRLNASLLPYPYCYSEPPITSRRPPRAKTRASQVNPVQSTKAFIRRQSVNKVQTGTTHHQDMSSCSNLMKYLNKLCYRGLIIVVERLLSYLNTLEPCR